MWIVKLALQRPYTFVVLSILIFLGGLGSAITAPKDIFPYINIPVVTIVWSYSGLTPTEMEGRIVTISERAMTTTVNDIEHQESESYQGVAVIHVYFQPSVQIDLAVAQVTAVVQTILRTLPPGTYPPNIIKYDASSVPILQLSLSGQGLTEADLYDLGISFIRPRLANVKGASVPLPYGGKVRQIMVDTDPNLMYAKHLSATDVSQAIAQQNLILPAGTARIGDREYVVKLNSSPGEIAALNDLPVRAANGSVVFIKDVAQVRDGYADQTNIVRENGKRGALLTVLKNGKTSTLDIVDGIKAAIPLVKAGLPPALTIVPLFDQSVFVRESITEVAREAAIAAVLTGLMILLFLGSWRSTLIVCTSIPLSIATSLVILTALGETINVMTLGGLALAVGILVDDATVEIGINLDGGRIDVGHGRIEKDRQRDLVVGDLVDENVGGCVVAGDAVDGEHGSVGRADAEAESGVVRAAGVVVSKLFLVVIGVPEADAVAGSWCTSAGCSPSPSNPSRSRRCCCCC